MHFFHLQDSDGDKSDDLVVDVSNEVIIYCIRKICICLILRLEGAQSSDPVND